MICSVPQVSIMEKLFPSWHLQLSWSCLPRPLVFSCQNVIKTTQKKKKYNENKGKCNQNNQRASEKRETKRRHTKEIFDFSANGCFKMPLSVLSPLPPAPLAAPCCLSYFATFLAATFCYAPHSLACVVLCRLSSLYEL